MNQAAPQKIFVAGHQGMVGSALVRALSRNPNNHVVVATRQQLDLVNQQAVRDFFAQQHIDQIYLAAAKVGGIYANAEYPADFIYQNLMIQGNVIEAAHQNNIQKLLFLGSSCIYPKFAEQPIKEQSLLTGHLEPSNESYAIAKIAGIKLCESYNRQYGRDYRSVMPTNLYGSHDNFHDQNSHVVPALIQRIYHAKQQRQQEIVIWGTGHPKREFLYVDDMADASIHVMNLSRQMHDSIVMPMQSHINIGTGIDISIADLAQMLCQIIGYTGQIIFDSAKPDGTPRKLLDVSRLTRTGWSFSTSLYEGLSSTYLWYTEHINQLRQV